MPRSSTLACMAKSTCGQSRQRSEEQWQDKYTTQWRQQQQPQKKKMVDRIKDATGSKDYLWWCFVIMNLTHVYINCGSRKMPVGSSETLDLPRYEDQNYIKAKHIYSSHPHSLHKPTGVALEQLVFGLNCPPGRIKTAFMMHHLLTSNIHTPSTQEFCTCASS